MAAAAGWLAEFMGTVGEVAFVAEGAHAAVHVVLTEGDFIVFIRGVVVFKVSTTTAAATTATPSARVNGAIHRFVKLAVLGNAEGKVSDDGALIRWLFAMAVATR